MQDLCDQERNMGPGSAIIMTSVKLLYAFSHDVRVESEQVRDDEFLFENWLDIRRDTLHANLLQWPLAHNNTC